MNKPNDYDSNWEGNYDLYLAYLESDRWRELRNEAIVRDGFRCVLCDNPQNLEVHHLSYPELLGTESVNSLITLCHGCHVAIEKLKKNVITKRGKNILPKLEFWIKFQNKKDFDSKQEWINAVGFDGNATVRVIAWLHEEKVSRYWESVPLCKYSALIKVFGADNVKLKAQGE